jgi:Domain of unknown function (DUF3883)
MEITDRRDLGENLWAPQAHQGGRPYWGYELITSVQPDDVVLHWHKRLMGSPGVVGWSVAADTFEATRGGWQARGTRGRATGDTRPRPAWTLPLTGYTPLLEPVLEDAVRARESDIRAVRDELADTYGEPLYFPFAISDKRPIRTTQSYLVKLPSKVVRVLGLDDPLPERTRSAPSNLPASAPGESGRGSGRSGYLADSRVRKAVEDRAVKEASDWYRAKRFHVVNVGATRPYDLVVTRGDESRRVEVKGSTGAAEAVELTIGEVLNAREYAPTDLVVVDGVSWVREADGSVTASGGQLRRWSDWVPAEHGLQVLRYRYGPPGD